MDRDALLSPSPGLPVAHPCSVARRNLCCRPASSKIRAAARDGPATTSPRSSAISAVRARSDTHNPIESKKVTPAKSTVTHRGSPQRPDPTAPPTRSLCPCPRHRRLVGRDTLLQRHMDEHVHRTPRLRHLAGRHLLPSGPALLDLETGVTPGGTQIDSLEPLRERHCRLRWTKQRGQPLPDAIGAGHGRGASPSVRCDIAHTYQSPDMPAVSGPVRVHPRP
jgi:hypothetical protein